MRPRPSHHRKEIKKSLRRHKFSRETREEIKNARESEDIQRQIDILLDAANIIDWNEEKQEYVYNLNPDKPY